MKARYPELVNFKAPTGLFAALTRLAELEQLSASAYLRRLVVEHVKTRRKTKPVR